MKCADKQLESLFGLIIANMNSKDQGLMPQPLCRTVALAPINTVRVLQI